MAVSSQTVLDRNPVESAVSAVSWAAIVAGTTAAMALAIVLTSLAAGLGLTTVSAWPNMGASATTFTITTGVGLIVVQWLASAFGGFITGRLRTKWAGLHTHEVAFRDTAHGLLCWALATVAGTIFLAVAASSVVHSGAQAAAPAVSTYTTDALFRSTNGNASVNQDVTTQAAHILANGVSTGDVPAADKTYLAQLVAAKTGISQEDAQKRVDDTIASVRKAAEAARKVTATVAIFTALSLMIGAFIAAVAATIGGRMRDEY
jgi:hypothetical protein